MAHAGSPQADETRLAAVPEVGELRPEIRLGPDRQLAAARSTLYGSADGSTPALRKKLDQTKTSKPEAVRSRTIDSDSHRKLKLSLREPISIGIGHPVAISLRGYYG